MNSLEDSYTQQYSNRKSTKNSDRSKSKKNEYTNTKAKINTIMDEIRLKYQKDKKQIENKTIRKTVRKANDILVEKMLERKKKQETNTRYVNKKPVLREKTKSSIRSRSRKGINTVFFIQYIFFSVNYYLKDPFQLILI